MALSQTSITGNIAEMAITSDLLRFGYEVYREVTNSGSSDLVAFRDGKFARLQVKSAHAKKGVAVFPCYHKGSDGRPIESHEFDIMAMYVPDRNVCLYITIGELLTRKTGFSVRFDPSRNKATKNIKLHTQYTSFDQVFAAVVQW